MRSDQPLCASLQAKIREQVERTGHLIALLPPDRVDGSPTAPGEWGAPVLLGHLLDCMAGVCAVLAAAHPEPLAHFSELRDLPVNHACRPDEALSRTDIYRSHIDEGFALLDDQALARRIPTVFVPEGETLLTLLLGNLEHLINHKHQLFTFLKQTGVGVNSRDLYHFRGGD